MFFFFSKTTIDCLKRFQVSSLSEMLLGDEMLLGEFQFEKRFHKDSNDNLSFAQRLLKSKQ